MDSFVNLALINSASVAKELLDRAQMRVYRSRDQLIVYARTVAHYELLTDHCASQIAQIACDRGVKTAHVVFGKGRQRRSATIPTSYFAENLLPNSQVVVPPPQRVIPYTPPKLQDMGLSFDAAEEDSRAHWIIDQYTNTVLWCNEAAVVANAKPQEEIVSGDIAALWQEESLQSLVKLVNELHDKPLTDHVNAGYRWKRGEGRLWERSLHQFNVDYYLINYRGRRARYEIVKDAVPV